MKRLKRGNSGQAVMIVIMGVMLVGGIAMWVTKGDFHMMPMHGSKDGHTKTGAAPSAHDAHGNAPDPAVDQHGADPEHVIEAEPVLDNP